MYNNIQNRAEMTPKQLELLVKAPGLKSLRNGRGELLPPCGHCGLQRYTKCGCIKKG